MMGVEFLLGKELTGRKRSGKSYSKSTFCETALSIVGVHRECGDSAFIFCDDSRAIVAVFDGVSGEAGSSMASSSVAKSVFSALADVKKIDKQKMESAMRVANNAIKTGSTTAVVAFVERSGEFMIASIGDSAVYGISKGVVSLELPIARVVKDGDAILKFFHYRNLVTSVLGGAKTEPEMHVCSGKLKNGEALLLASDGLSDNLFAKVKDGYVIDSSGCEDLQVLLKKGNRLENLLSAIQTVILSRMKGGRVERNDELLIPKKDDLAMAVVRLF